MDALQEAFQGEFSRLAEAAPRFVLGVGILLVFVVLGRIFAQGVKRFLAKGDRPSRHGQLPPRLVRWSAGLIGLGLALQAWGLTGIAASLLATGGLVAVVLGFAFREIGENLLAGLLLSFNRSFEVGDIIECDGLRGRVRGLDLRTVHIRASDGADIFIPNAQIVRNPLFNFTRDGLRRGSFTVGIDYGDNPELARATVLAAIVGVPGVLDHPPPKIQISAFLPQYQELTGSFWVDALVDGVDFASVRTGVLAQARTALMEGQFTLSAGVLTGVELEPVTVRTLTS